VCVGFDTTGEEMRTENILCERMRVKVHGFGGVAIIYIYVRQSIPSIAQSNLPFPKRSRLIPRSANGRSPSVNQALPPKSRVALNRLITLKFIFKKKYVLIFFCKMNKNINFL